MNCKHIEVIILDEHPKINNVSSMGNDQFYWATCFNKDCLTTLLRPESFFEKYGFKFLYYKNEPIIYGVNGGRYDG